MCSCRGRAVSWLKAGVSSKQFWKSETRAKMYRPSLALDMATTKRLTSLGSGGSSEGKKHDKFKIGPHKKGIKKVAVVEEEV